MEISRGRSSPDDVRILRRYGWVSSMISIRWNHFPFPSQPMFVKYRCRLRQSTANPVTKTTSSRDHVTLTSFTIYIFYSVIDKKLRRTRRKMLAVDTISSYITPINHLKTNRCWWRHNAIYDWLFRWDRSLLQLVDQLVQGPVEIEKILHLKRWSKLFLLLVKYIKGICEELKKIRKFDFLREVYCLLLLQVCWSLANTSPVFEGQAHRWLTCDIGRHKWLHMFPLSLQHGFDAEN